MTKLRGIIVLEGADATGKTTLAKTLVRKFGARYLHLGIHRDIWRWHLAAVRRAVRLAEHHLVVVDRLWLSEQAYGQAFRGGPAYDLGARTLDRVLQRYGALTVLCVRRDFAGHMYHFERLKTERPEKFDGIERVAQLYYDLWSGNVAHPGDTYLDQLIRHQDFSNRIDVTHYDMDRTQGSDEVEAVASRLAHRVNKMMIDRFDELRRFDRPNLVGSIQMPRFLFVGEGLSPKAGTEWPFVWSDQLSAATWLNAALHRLHFDETTALWTNALHHDQWLFEVRSMFPGIKVIALGRLAHDHVRGAGIDCVMLPHPQWHRRFQHKNPTDYDELLKEAMRK